MTTANQQQLIAYKRGYYDRGIEIESLKAIIEGLEATIEELESKVKAQEETPVEAPVEAKKPTSKKKEDK